MTHWYLARVNTSFFYIWLRGILCSLWLITPVLAAERCSNHRTGISLSYSMKPTEYIRDISARELTDSHKGGNEAGIILGHARGAVRTGFTMEYEFTPLRARLYCFRVKKIRARFIAEPIIHIASNFKRGSCEYSRVLRHENEHVKILRKAHKGHVAGYKAHLRKVVRKIPDFPPMKITEIEQYKAEAADYINKAMSEYMEYITKDVLARQKKFDTPKEYQRVNKQCKRWDKKLKDD
ncbi:MAG: hypothetical protein COA45_11830 [Zetaproteobacteria bacterium]|nr:MAG: hypothetical protein COA45_11830 [Zetaproteobacteria bacterium]